MAKTLASCLREAVQQCAADTARLDAEVLLAHVLDKPRSYLYTWPDKQISAEQEAQFQQAWDSYCQNKPIAYITGYREFWTFTLCVNPSTLIPRPETEQLVDAILRDYPMHSDCVVWDAGTGSGAIALALKSERPQWQISASDISYEALKAAQHNAQRLQLPINIVQASWLDAVAADSLDILVSNPPYIAEDDAHLAALTYEPITALTATNKGLSDIEQLCQQAMRVLKPRAKFYVEHGYQQQEAVQAIFQTHGFLAIETEKDYAGLPRFSHGVKP